MTFAEMVTAVTVEGGVDTTTGQVTADQVKDRINARYRQMVATARYRMAQITIGPTVAGQAEYALEDDIVHVDGILVGALPYRRQSQTTLWRLRAGDARLSGRGGIFAPDFAGDGARQVELYPAPTDAGIVITALAALQPVALSGDNDEPIVPLDYQDAIVEGAIADFLTRLDERPDLAGVFEQKFTDKTEFLKRLQKSQLQSGPSQIQVGGYHI